MDESDTGITRLRRIAVQLSGDDGRWFRECLELYQAGARDGLRLEVCLGLVPERGRTPWWERESCAERDKIVRGIAAKYCAAMRTTDAARWIVGQACIYETGEYRFHRKLMASPTTIEGTVRAVCSDSWRRTAELVVPPVRRCLPATRRSCAHSKNSHKVTVFAKRRA